MWTLLTIVLIGTSIILRLSEPKLKGIIGEKRVIKQLEKLSSENYVVLNDIMLPSEKGTSQIDHVVLSPYGIFVIETKNYSGWIHGSENSEYWTQSIYKTKMKFRNPIRQNWGHIYALKQVLSEYSEIPFIPIVVFAGTAKLKNLSVRTDVIYEDKLYEKILEHRGVPVISSSDMERLTAQLRQTSIIDKEARKSHNNQIKVAVKERRARENAKICPKCGGTILLRSGKYGEFYGCSNYPKCRYKMNA